LRTVFNQLMGMLTRAAIRATFNAHQAQLRHKPPTRTVRSVLQVSVMSTKPYMVSRVLRACGLRSDYYALNTDAGHLNLGWDYSLPTSLSPLQHLRRAWQDLWAVFSRYDVIHYHFNSTLLWDGAELPFLRQLGKVIVFHFRGCDLRQRRINNLRNPDLNCCQECDYPVGFCDTPDQRRRLKLAQEYGDLFFVTTPDLLDFFPNAEYLPFIAPYGVELDAIAPSPKTAGVFRVVTSSNHHGLDGTAYIRDAVLRLQNEGRLLELVEVHGMPYHQALSVYKSADLFAGKLRMGYYNNANIECMMLGVPCMSYIRTPYLKQIPDCPIINTRPETVYDRLKEYLKRPEELKRIGALGPEFVRKYHDPIRLANHLIFRYKEAMQNKNNKFLS